MVIVTEKTKNDISIKFGISSGFESNESQMVVIQLVNKDHRILVEINAKTKRAIVIFLECIKMAYPGSNLEDRLKKIRKLHSTILKISGKVGEDEEQLADNPSQDNEFELFKEYFFQITEKEIWESIRSTGLHELLPA